MTEDHGLTTRTPGVITSAEEYSRSMQTWREKFNVMTPFTSVSGIAPSFGIIASVVRINPEAAGGEVYSGTTPDGRPAMPFLKGKKGEASEELAIAKIGLRKIAECGGISTSTTRTDPRTIPHYWEFKATASYRGLDGSTVTREATFEWDLRDGSDRMKGWTANQITEGRKNGLRACESRAINAAIRECGCGIKQKYTRAELEKPFLVVRVAFQPDMQDPAIKEMVTRQALGGVHAMYPAAGRELPPADVVDAEEIAADSPRQVGRGSTAATAPAKPAEDLPPVEGAVKIAKAVEVKPWEKGGRKGERYLIVDSNGVQYSTFDKQHRADADRFFASKDWVEIITEKNGEFTNIVEIVKAGSEPNLPGLDEV
jgi:hypothetical protein